MAKHPTTKSRKKWQRKKKAASQTLEKMRLKGEAPMVPEEALHEVVDPSTQSSQPLPGLVGQAIRKGWATPEERKPALVDELCNIVVSEEAKPFDKVAAFNALTRGDQVQFERDNPEAAGKAKGSTNVNVGVAVGFDYSQLWKGGQREQETTVHDKMQRAIEERKLEQAANGSNQLTAKEDNDGDMAAETGTAQAGE